jgi:two-component system, NarL family, nitrate/nitrite response regulator NarL
MTAIAQTRVVIADDHPVVLSGLKSLIQLDAAFHVVESCQDGASALSAIRKARPDLAVLDINMPELSGLDVLAALRSDESPTRVVFLTASALDAHVVQAVASGAHGIMLKDAAADSLLDCLRKVAAGGRWLPEELINGALEREAGRRVEVERIEQVLTTREREIVMLAAEGLSNKQIARRLNVAEGTIKIHLHNVYQKLGVANRTAMSALALTYRAQFKPKPS